MCFERISDKLFTKKDMAEIHPAMEKHLCKALGVERVGMLLDEKDREQKAKKTLSKLDHEEYVAVTREIERAGREVAELSERSECLRQEVEELEPLAVTFGESVRTLIEHRGDGSKERGLAEEESSLAGEVEELEQQVRAAGEREEELEGQVRGLGDRVRDLGARLEHARMAVTEALKALTAEVPRGLSEIAKGIARKLNLPISGKDSDDEWGCDLDIEAMDARDVLETARVASMARQLTKDASKQLDTGVSHGRRKTEHR